MASDGYTYERSALQEWLEHTPTSPITGERLSDLTLRENVTVRSLSRSLQRRLFSSAEATA